jgi:hypothetical protein
MTEHDNGYTIQLEDDEDADNPLDWTTFEERQVWFALRHKRYTLPFEIDADPDEYQSWQELAEAVTGPDGELAGKAYQIVRWHEHSGIAVSLLDTDRSGDWDTGCAGVIFGTSRAAILASFAVWKAYVEGDVYTVRVTAPDGNVVDQLVGLYGYDEATGCACWIVGADAKLTGVERIWRYGRAHTPRAQELHA